MNDTSPEMAAKLRELFMQRSGAERLRMGCDMFTAARAMMIAGLEAQGYRGDELRRQILLRTYGQDFAPTVLEKICRVLAR
jgi:hypothetical protein